MTDLDIPSEIARLKQQTQEIRRSAYRTSRLDRYAAEILALHQGGASIAEITRWLRANARIRRDRTTVSRWIAKHTKQDKP